MHREEMQEGVCEGLCEGLGCPRMMTRAGMCRGLFALIVVTIMVLLLMVVVAVRCEQLVAAGLKRLIKVRGIVDDLTQQQTQRGVYVLQGEAIHCDTNKVSLRNGCLKTKQREHQ